MKQPKAITDWMTCVRQAKIKFGMSPNIYEPIKGPVLQEARKLYCSLGY